MGLSNITYTCSVATCRKIGPKNRCSEFYKFPTDSEWFELWSNIFRKVKLTLPEKDFISDQKYRICSDHFAHSAFVDPCDYRSGLRRNAVPTVGISETYEEDYLSSESDSDSWDDLEEGQPQSSINALKKRLIKNKKENERLKRTVERLRRQNDKFKQRLS